MQRTLGKQLASGGAGTPKGTDLVSLDSAPVSLGQVYTRVGVGLTCWVRRLNNALKVFIFSSSYSHFPT